MSSAHATMSSCFRRFRGRTSCSGGALVMNTSADSSLSAATIARRAVSGRARLGTRPTASVMPGTPAGASSPAISFSNAARTGTLWRRFPRTTCTSSSRVLPWLPRTPRPFPERSESLAHARSEPRGLSCTAGREVGTNAGCCGESLSASLQLRFGGRRWRPRTGTSAKGSSSSTSMLRRLSLFLRMAAAGHCRNALARHA
mmetsp:Transcript_53111/g.147813  ORF Transcript_53111/g.147813 Transcript_53111/m.147813 type:complete len:201 (+) Transcript_53111:1934-2536(+)